MVKVGSWLHNTIGIFIILLSIYLGIQRWPDEKAAAIVLFIFAVVIALCIIILTRKRRSLEKGGK